MSHEDTKERIVRALRNTSEPALSAQKLADALEVSVRTINNHVDHLLDEDRIAATQIGNATAYYIPFSDLPNHKKPDHTCARCGREVGEGYDFAKIEHTTYFTRGNLPEEAADFYIFCRFCYEDLVKWVMDPGGIGDYPFVHSWDIPLEQLEEVRDDPEIETLHEESRHYLDEDEAVVLDIIEAYAEEAPDGVWKETVIEAAEEQHEMFRMQVEEAINNLKRRGLVFVPDYDRYKLAK